jgi:hypothetical protein
MVGRLWNTSASEANQFFGRKKQWSRPESSALLNASYQLQRKDSRARMAMDDVLDKEVRKT